MKKPTTHILLKRILGILLVVTVFLFNPASAHATSLIESNPRSGAVINIAPDAITLTANAQLDANGSEAVVTDPIGKKISDGTVEAQGANLIIGLKPLTKSGIYTVSYTLVAVNDVPVTGSFTFLFNAPATLDPNTDTMTAENGLNQNPNRMTDLIVIAMMIFAFVVMVWLSRFARRNFGRQVKKDKKISSEPKPKSKRKTFGR